MCGIFFNAKSKPIRGRKMKGIKHKAKKLEHRGPDHQRCTFYGYNVMMGFCRLAIMDTTIAGQQPFESVNKRYICMVNGEIYNYEYLQKWLGKQLVKDGKKKITYNTASDCEVVVHLFEYLIGENDCHENDWHEALKILCGEMLDGEFALVIYDQVEEIVYFGTDELSVRPLFIQSDMHDFYISSEQKALSGSTKRTTRLRAGQFGRYFTSIRADRIPEYHTYHDLNTIPQVSPEAIYSDEVVGHIKYLLEKNVEKKLHPDREMGFLLSGGLDSSLVCAIAARRLHPKRIKTFTVGFSPNSTDVLAAQKVADHIGSDHKTFIVSYDEGIEIISRVIKYNESWDQTTTRASVPMALCVSRIKKEYPDIAVIYSGEVADELFMGYLYNRKPHTSVEGRKDQIMRLKDIHMFDGLRADRVCSSYSCELRLPFFGKDLLRYVLSLPIEMIDPLHNNNIEKYILRKAFDTEDTDDNPYLPKEILWRTKNAMSDATSVQSGWKEHLKGFCDEQVTDSRFDTREDIYLYKTPQTKEDMYYRDIFDSYGYDETTIPYKWMSSWCDPKATDSSASTIDVFEEDQI